MKKFGFLFFLLIIVSCGNPLEMRQDEKGIKVKNLKKPSIAGTVWECLIAEECIDRYTFKKDSTFTLYSCEIDDNYFGEYSLSEDTLIILENRNVLNELTGKVEYIEKSKYWVLIENNQLKFLKKSDWHDGKFIPSAFSFENSSKCQLVEKKD